jgi:hypothetical protein
VGIGQRGVLAVVAIVGIRTASVVVSRRDACRHILINGHDQVQSPQVFATAIAWPIPWAAPVTKATRPSWVFVEVFIGINGREPP